MPPRKENMIETITGMELVHIPGGCFQMGSPDNSERDEDEAPLLTKFALTAFIWGNMKLLTDNGERSYKKNKTIHCSLGLARPKKILERVKIIR